MDYTGTTGNDTITGNQFEFNTFDMSQGGNDTVTGGNVGNKFYFGAAFTAADSVKGGNFQDTLELNGDYSAGVIFGSHTVVNVDTIQLDNGHSYKLTTNDATVAANSFLDITASALGANDKLIFNGAAETNGNIGIEAGAGNDTLTGGAGNDIFNLTAGGNDTVHGGGGVDLIDASGAFDARDSIDGGAGYDFLILTTNDPNFSKVVFGPHTVVNVEVIEADNMSITTNDATVARGKTLGIDGEMHDHGQGGLDVDGSAETDGHFFINGTELNDILIGGAQNDKFVMGNGGNDTVKGGGGNDLIDFGGLSGPATGSFTSLDKIDGGAGTDTVQLEADITGSHALKLSSTTMVNVEILKLLGGDSSDGPYSYNITTADATVAAGQKLTINASSLTANESLTFNGKAETDGHFTFESGAGTDILTGGKLGDTFMYDDHIALSGATRDAIHSFDFSNDIVKFAAVTGIDAAVTTGKASKATIDTDLTNIFGPGKAHQLGAHHAELFTASSGDLAGQTFLIVDHNGHAGYDAGHDLVIQLIGALNTGDLSTANFIG